MKAKKLLVVAGALVMGAAANVLVAWWCAAHPRTERWTQYAREDLGTKWLVTSVAEYRGCSRCVGGLVASEAEAKFQAGQAAHNTGATGTLERRAPSWALSPDILAPVMVVQPVHFESVASGWPMLALVYHEVTSRGVSPPALGVMQRGLAHHNPKLYRQRRLAFLPVWPGFAVNTVVYGLPWVGLYWWVGWAHRANAPLAARRVRGVWV